MRSSRALIAPRSLRSFAMLPSGSHPSSNTSMERTGHSRVFWLFLCLFPVPRRSSLAFGFLILRRALVKVSILPPCAPWFMLCLSIPEYSQYVRRVMELAAPITTYRITDHAQREMVRRQIHAADVRRVLALPEQTERIRPGRVVYQSRAAMGKPPTTYLLHVFVDVDRQPVEVVTVYRTSKIAKYWRGTP